MSKTYRNTTEDYRIEKTVGVKPKHTRYCYDCRKNKLLFSTKEKAERYLSYNATTIEEENGYAPVRAYYCKACGGWHVTHLEEFNAQSKYEIFYDNILINKKKKKKSKTTTIQSTPKDPVESFQESFDNTIKKISEHYEKGNFFKCEKEINKITEILQTSIGLPDDLKDFCFNILEVFGSKILFGTIA